MATQNLTEEQLRRLVADMARRMPQNRQRYASTGRMSRQNLNISDLTARDINPSLGLRRPEAAEAAPEVAPKVDADVPVPETPSRTTSDTEGPANLEMPDLSPIQARMRDDYLAPAARDVGKRMGKRAIEGSLLSTGIGIGPVPGAIAATFNPYSIARNTYGLIDEASDANYRGKQLENIFSEQGIDFNDPQVAEQITQAQDYASYAGDLKEEGWNPEEDTEFDTGPPGQLDLNVLAAITKDPTWGEKTGLKRLIDRFREGGGDAGRIDENNVLSTEDAQPGWAGVADPGGGPVELSEAPQQFGPQNMTGSGYQDQLIGEEGSEPDGFDGYGGYAPGEGGFDIDAYGDTSFDGGDESDGK